MHHECGHAIAFLVCVCACVFVWLARTLCALCSQLQCIFCLVDGWFQVVSFSFDTGSSSTLTSDCATSADIQRPKSRNSTRSSPIIVNHGESVATDAPKFFGHLNSFQPYDVQKIHEPVQISSPNKFTCFKQFANIPIKPISPQLPNALPVQMTYTPLVEPLKMNAEKPSQSFFQIAKDFCGQFKHKAKANIDSSIDELTKRMASLQLGIPKMLLASQNIKSNLTKFGSLMDVCSGF